MRTVKAGQKIAPSIPVCRRCDRSPPRMLSQLVSFFLHSPRDVTRASPQYVSYPSPSSYSYKGWYRRTPCCFVKLFVAKMVKPESPQHSPQACAVKHIQFVEISCCHSPHFGLHTVARTAHLSSGCAAWSSGWICLTSRCSEVWWRQF